MFTMTDRLTSSMLLVACFLSHAITHCDSFSIASRITSLSRDSRFTVDGKGICAVPFFADDTQKDADEMQAQSDIRIVPSAGDAPSIKEAAGFMVDAFWLQSPQNLLMTNDKEAVISDGAKMSLIEHQEEDLMNKYGERMGKRQLESCLLTAVGEDGSILGLIAIEARLLDKAEEQILTAERSEFMLKNAVASLGPKQRREYKNSPASELCTELLPPEFVLVCVLSNLAVDPKARRKGVAIKLCKGAEKMAKEDWSFDEMYLKVEKENEAAKGLYEEKLRYSEQFSDASSIGLRVDIETGSFVEQQAETLALSKTL